MNDEDRATADAAITIRVTRAQKAQAERLADLDGSSIADVVRRPFLAALRAAVGRSEGGEAR